MLFWHEYNVKKALDDMPNFKAFQGKWLIMLYVYIYNYVCTLYLQCKLCGVK